MSRFGLVLLVVGGCASPAVRAQERPGPPDVDGGRAPADAAATAACPDEGEAYAEAALRARIDFLAGAALDGRAPASDGDAAARAHVEARFRCLGLTAGLPDGAYQQPFVDAKGRSTANVIAYLPGSDPAVAGEVILVAAHHDHLGAGFPGANDNASGTTALLAIAQALAQRPTAPRRTVVFVAFGAEESGEGGSQFYVANPPAGLGPDQLVYMVNLDMLGSYDSRGAVYAMGTFKGLAGNAAVKTAATRWPDLRVARGGRAYRSDHEPFCARGIPYVFFWTPDDACYHEACDTPANLDYPHLAQLAELAGDTVLALADSDVDLAAARQKRGCATPR